MVGRWSLRFLPWQYNAYRGKHTGRNNVQALLIIEGFCLHILDCLQQTHDGVLLLLAF
jgi:hypothetical protein